MRRSVETNCSVQVTVDDATAVVRIRGREEDVQKAEQMLTDIMSAAPRQREHREQREQREQPERKEKEQGERGVKGEKGEKEKGEKLEQSQEVKEVSIPAKKAKEAAEFRGSSDDFPQLGGSQASARRRPEGPWSRNAKAKDEAPAAAAFPPLVSEAPSRAEEEEFADDPFALLGGMGQEQIYKVTLMEPSAEEEEEEGFDDPFALMCGMGQEQVYKVTLDIAPSASAPEAPEAEAESDEDCAVTRSMSSKPISRWQEDEAEDEA